MIEKALETVKAFDMLEKGDTVIAAVSGGADSMALLRFLLEIRDEYSLSIHVCHVNHMLRDIEADRDEAFVRDFCAAHSLPFHLLRADVSAIAEKNGKGFEECGRQVRYSFFSKISEDLGGNVKTAIAHNLNDNAETLLLHIARGCSVNGLCGIAPKRGNIIRPLINCEREEIEKYLALIGQSYVTDSTNSDIHYNRNLIRKNIIPEIKKINPAFLSAAKNLCDISAEVNNFIDSEVNSAYAACFENGALVRNRLIHQSPAVMRGITVKFLSENNVEVSKKRCDELMSLYKNSTFRLSVCKNGYVICRSDGMIRFLSVKASEASPFDIPVSIGEFKLPDGRTLKIKPIEREEFLFYKANSPNLLKNCINYDIINNGVRLRTRREGDFIDLFPRNVTKTLKKLLIESKIPAEKRDIIPVIAAENRVLWVEGLGVDALAAVTKQVNRIALIETV